MMNWTMKVEGALLVSMLIILQKLAQLLLFVPLSLNLATGSVVP